MQEKLIVKNKKASFDFEIRDTYEAGVILTGAEIKSVRSGKVQLRGSFVAITPGGRAVAENIHIGAYQPANQPDYNPTRRRTLLLHKKEIDQLSAAQNERGIAVIPMEIYLKKGLAKIRIGIGVGRKKYDKREVLKKRSQEKEIRKALKNRI
ncbi:MAG: SsrA-binding protein SmpB [Patescibacteria group bacterium]